MDSFNLITKILVENIQKKSNTQLTFSNLRINTDVKDNLFCFNFFHANLFNEAVCIYFL